LPVGLVFVLVLAVLIAVSRLFIWYSEYDGKRIDPAVRQAIFAHATKGTRIPVTLWSGPRILQIEYAMVQFARRSSAAAALPTALRRPASV
jgi:hypothetical protein